MTGVPRFASFAAGWVRATAERVHLARIKSASARVRPGGIVRFLDMRARITDGASFYIQYKDEFIRRIYGFTSSRPNPFIIDGGGNIGMSVLFFKRLYPEAQVIVFEPDPAICAILRENIGLNNIYGVTVVQAAVSGRPGRQAFHADGGTGGRLAALGNLVDAVLLSSYVVREVDLLKLNIEGEELTVLQELADSGRLRAVRQIIVEYHGWQTGPQALGNLLNLLDQNGFRYLVHDFDRETCSASKPPFQVHPVGTWFCLVCAARLP